MKVSPNTRLGRYEILSPLGAGGMGEVYLAHDTQLDRQVAVKILPTEIASDPQDLLRFLQEARAASKLKSANVAHIYEIGEAEGLRFIAMEYVEGQSLREKISERQLPAVDILRIALQLARALEEAHSKGVVHRDIKPENIVVTAEGEVKVLDFGVAKLDAVLPSVTDDTPESELATRVMTSPGVVLGTVSYMSPEQALARQVDARTDIFSLGVVLYEMATGRVPFSGSSVTETIDKIVHAQPEAVARLNYEIPAELEVIIKKALRKNRDERYQTVREMLIDLKALHRELDIASHLQHSEPPDSRKGIVTEASITPGGEQPTSKLSAKRETPSTAETTATRTNTSSAEYLAGEIKRHKKGVVLALAALVVITGAFSLVWYKFIRHTGAPPSARQMKITRLVTGLIGRPGNVSISPDGKYVAYSLNEAGKASLWVRQVSQDASLQIVPPVESTWFSGTTFSKDAELIYFVSGNKTNTLGSLYQVPVLGGREPRKILDHVSSTVSFSPDGKQFVFGRETTDKSEIFIASIDGSGELRKLASRHRSVWPKGNDWLGASAWSPDGKTIAFIAGTNEGGINYTVVEMPVEGGQERLITNHKWRDVLFRVLWVENGNGLIVSGRERWHDPVQIWHVSYPTGELRRVTNDLNDYGDLSLQVTSDSSTLATVLSEWSSKIWVAAPNDDESHARKITNGKQDGRSGLSSMPDGRIVYSARVGDNSDIWIMNADGTGAKALTSDAFTDSWPTVPRDGRYIVYESMRPDNLPHIWRMDVDGGNPRQLTSGDDHRPMVSPDGQWVVFDSWRAGKLNLWKVPIDGGEAVQIHDRIGYEPVLSLDGKLLLCGYFDGAGTPPRYRPAIISFDDGKLIRVIDLPVTAGNVRWSADGKEFLYVDSRGDIGNLWSQPVAGGAPKQLTRFTSEFVSYFDVSRDGKRFIISRTTGGNDIILIKDFR
jgi:eukaryotic-like serine/threonine-protein kinase